MSFYSPIYILCKKFVASDASDIELPMIVFITLFVRIQIQT